MQYAFLITYFALVPALCCFTLYKFARLWLWTAPLIATVLGTVMVVLLRGFPGGDEMGLIFWSLLMPIQQLIALSICLGTLVGMRWGGSLGLAVGGAGVVLGLMAVAVLGLGIFLYPVCILLFALVLVLSFTGKAKKAWDEYRQGNTPEL